MAAGGRGGTEIATHQRTHSESYFFPELVFFSRSMAKEEGGNLFVLYLWRRRARSKDRIISREARQ